MMRSEEDLSKGFGLQGSGLGKEKEKMLREAKAKLAAKSGDGGEETKEVRPWWRRGVCRGAGWGRN